MALITIVTGPRGYHGDDFTAGLFLKIFSLSEQAFMGRAVDPESLDLSQWPVAGKDHVVGYW